MYSSKSHEMILVKIIFIKLILSNSWTRQFRGDHTKENIICTSQIYIFRAHSFHLCSWFWIEVNICDNYMWLLVLLMQILGVYKKFGKNMCKYYNPNKSAIGHVNLSRNSRNTTKCYNIFTTFLFSVVVCPKLIFYLVLPWLMGTDILILWQFFVSVKSL